MSETTYLVLRQRDGARDEINWDVVQSVLIAEAVAPLETRNIREIAANLSREGEYRIAEIIGRISVTSVLKAEIK